MGGYLAYSEYKESGVEWLGEIPAHWIATVLKFHYDIQLGKMLQPQPHSDEDEETSYLKAFHVQWKGVNVEDLPKMWASPKDLNKYFVENGDLLICEGGEVGRAALLQGLEEECIIQNSLHRVRGTKRACLEFLNYFMRHVADSGWFDILCSKATIAHLTGEKLAIINFPLAPIAEQRQITAFLDYKTGQIDALIAKKEALLEKLAEKRTALISQAVTKGLDPSVPMQDSGIPWLGDIPAHWEIKRLKFVVDKIVDTPHKTAPYDDDGEFLVVRTTNVRNGRLLLDGAKYTDEETYKEWISRATPEPGDILFTREAPAGEACLIPEQPKLCLGQRMVLFKFDHTKYDGYFLLQAIYSGIADEFIQSLSLGSTVAHFNMSDIGSIPLIIPPYAEQQSIGTWLEERVKYFDTQVDQVELGIRHLKEYRTALITNAVTGKIDVRDIKLPTPTPAEAA